MRKQGRLAVGKGKNKGNNSRKNRSINLLIKLEDRSRKTGIEIVSAWERLE